MTDQSATDIPLQVSAEAEAVTPETDREYALVLRGYQYGYHAGYITAANLLPRVPNPDQEPQP